MTGREVFKIWAPLGSKWVEWVRPVSFVAIGNGLKEYGIYNLMKNDIVYTNKASKSTAIIVDLPGYESVEEAIELAKIGYRPIPIYNGTNEQERAMATSDNTSVEIALIKGAAELEKINLPNDAPPAFLLDTNRMSRYKMNVGIFDNSWDVYNQDMPTAKYLVENGIKKIIVRADEKIQKDLRKILYKYQVAGINILFADSYKKPKKIIIRKPSKREEQI
ncbi:MAG: hypothetical protein J6B87_06865 [Clostridia bacterium]|nr:hypothetical protein [Clostridia bacterium]